MYYISENYLYQFVHYVNDIMFIHKFSYDLIQNVENSICRSSSLMKKNFLELEFFLQIVESHLFPNSLADILSVNENLSFSFFFSPLQFLPCILSILFLFFSHSSSSPSSYFSFLFGFTTFSVELPSSVSISKI